FGERFTAIRYRDVLIDPGPPFGAKRLERYLGAVPGHISAVVATHAHEEHVGNAALASRLTGAPIFGSEVTLRAAAHPMPLSGPRRVFIGQPPRSETSRLCALGGTLETPKVRLAVISSPGHCDGHVSLFDP